MRYYIGGMLIFLALLFAFPLQAADDNKAVMTYRNRVMGGIGSNMGSISDILKQKVSYGSMLVHYARALHEQSQTIVTVFTQDTRGTDKRTRAKDEIWENWADFEMAANALVEAGAQLVAAAESGDMAQIGEAVKSVGAACGDCHKPFRAPSR
jgi:cytochrome c556